MARVEKAKKQIAASKRPRSRPRKRLVEEIKEENENKDIATSSNNSNIELEQSVSRRTRARITK